MRLLAHHLGEDSLTGLLIVSGGMVPVLATVGRTKVAHAWRRVRHVLERATRPADR